MSARFLALSAADRRLAFENAALGLRLSPVVLEKDFWVSWLLGLLFKEPAWAEQMVFKGGTSLSKVFGVIDRFSEVFLRTDLQDHDIASFLASRSNRFVLLFIYCI